MTARELLRLAIADLALRAHASAALADALDGADSLRSLTDAELDAAVAELNLHRLLTARRDLMQRLDRGEINGLVERLAAFLKQHAALRRARLFH